MKLEKDFRYLYEINADGLDDYYTGVRYPPLLEVDSGEAMESIEIARKVRDFVLGKLR